MVNIQVITAKNIPWITYNDLYLHLSIENNPEIYSPNYLKFSNKDIFERLLSRIKIQW